MESSPREAERREVRASVFRVCLRRGEAAEIAAKGLTESLRVEALVSAGVAADDEEARRWLEEDLADFSRAVLVSELVSRRIGDRSAPAPSTRRSRSEAPVETKRPSSGGTPSVADLLDGMLAQDKQR